VKWKWSPYPQAGAEDADATRTKNFELLPRRGGPPAVSTCGDQTKKPAGCTGGFQDCFAGYRIGGGQRVKIMLHRAGNGGGRSRIADDVEGWRVVEMNIERCAVAALCDQQPVD